MLKTVLENQASEATVEAQQAMKNENTTLARSSLKKAKDIKKKLEQMK